MPSCRDLLNSLVKGSTINMADIFSNFVGISSGPVDLLGSKEFNNSRTSRSETTMLSRAGTDLACLLGMFLQLSICRVVSAMRNSR